MGGIEIFKLFGSIFVDTDEANKSMGKTEKKTEGLAKKLGNGIKTAGKWALGLTTAAIGIGTAAFAMTNKVTKGFDEIAKNSTKLGITTDAYQEMDYWASQNGISQGNMEKAIGRLNQRIGAAKEGNEKYSGALEKLGINMDDVRDGTVSTEDAMTQSIQALSEMTNEQDKAALASELFGTKLGRELMPALQDGSLSIEDAKKAAEELGIVIGEDTINAGVEFQDNLTDMMAGLKGVGNNIMAGLIPIFNTMTNWILDNMPTIQAVFQTVFDVINTVFSTAVGWVQSLIAWLSEWFTSNEETMFGIWETIQIAFLNIVEFLQETWEMLLELWHEHGEAILEYAIFAFNNVVEVITIAFATIWEVIQTVLGLVWPFIQETLAKIFDFWDKHGQQIMDAVQNAFKIIQGVINAVMPIVTSIISSAWSIISGIFGSTLDIIMGVIRTFSGLFTGNWEELWNGVKDTASSIWDGIVNVIKAPINLIIGLVNGMIDGLNKIKIKLPKVPDWVPGLGGKGGGEIGFNIPNIPSLATGGVVHDPTLAMIGDAGAGNPEIVTPEKMLRSIFDEALINNNGNKETHNSEIIRLLIELIKAVREGKFMQIDGATFAKIMGEYIDSEGGIRVRNVERGLAT